MVLFSLPLGGGFPYLYIFMKFLCFLFFSIIAVMPYALADDIVATIDHIQITRSELQKHMNQSYGEE